MRVILKKITYFLVVFGVLSVTGMKHSIAVTHDPSTHDIPLPANYELPSHNISFSDLIDCLSYFDPTSERQHRTKNGEFFTGYEQIFTMLLNDSLVPNSSTLEGYNSTSVLAYLHGRPSVNEDFNRFVLVTETSHQCIQVPKSEFNIEIDGSHLGIHRILDLASFFKSEFVSFNYVLNYRNIDEGNTLSLPMLTSDSPFQFSLNFQNLNLGKSEELYLRPNPRDHLCDVSENDRYIQELLSVEIISQMIAYFAQDKLEQMRRAEVPQDSPSFKPLVSEFSRKVNSCKFTIESHRTQIQSITQLERKGQSYEIHPLLDSLRRSAAELDFIYSQLLIFSLD